jgi:glycosyltransferase involved in cell wall biosynthesis
VRETLIADGTRADRITVIYNGLDLTRLTGKSSRLEALRALHLPPDTPPSRRFISIVANMRHEVKDYPMFLRSARRVKEAVAEAAFLLAGEGELSDSLKGLTRELGIADSTFFLGRCERVAELLGISEVCVLSSKAEGFSNSILEYMAASRPVVATDVGGAREAIVEGQTGYLVLSGDDVKMAERIIMLLKDPMRARTMGENGRLVVQEKFSTEAQLRRTAALYDTLLKRGRR